MENIQDISVYASQKQLQFPFRISNRGLDSNDRYLSFKNTQHVLQQKYLVESDQKKQGIVQISQIWQIQHSKGNRQLYTIKLNQTDLYLTLVKSKNVDQYFVQLTKLKEDQSAVNQLWSFDLGQNNRFIIKVEPTKGTFYYLQSPQASTLKEGYNNLFVCRPQPFNSHSYLRNWKLSPVQKLIEEPTFISKPQSFQILQVQTVFPSIQNLLKCFKGKIYKKGHPLYKTKIQQYATSSYPESQMQPFIIAYPQDIEDISCIIDISKLLNKKVVARSGGHQYCGLSSGGQKTIVLSMDKFNTLSLNQEGLVEIGPCVPLKKAVRAFRDWNISLPHGECPLVNIGGHGQTGGYGYFIRSFGLFIDHIQAFDIVLADGKLRRVNRPPLNAVITTQEQRLNLQLFRGVLGGNAGSFGIVTKYILKGNKDSDHPESYGFSKVRFFNKDRLIQVMKTYKEWSKLVASKEDKQKLKGLDIQLTVGQTYVQFFNFKMPVLILEGVYSDPDGKVPYNNQFKQLYDKFMQGITFTQKILNLFLGRWQGKYPLSYLNYKHVRKFPMVTFSGRQFDLPYEKRCNITYGPLNDEFIKEFAEQVAYLANHKKKSLLVLVQTMCGGGVYRDNGDILVDGLTVTSIPNRQSVHNFVYDIFYNTKTDPNAKNEAIQLQQKMQQTVNKYYNTTGFGQKRYFWGSFGDIDMTHETVIDNYYDSRQQYAHLQRLKQRVDPQDVFNSPMTVKLPTK